MERLESWREAENFRNFDSIEHPSLVVFDMSYALSIHPVPPSAPNALFSMIGQYLRVPSVWRMLSRQWERNLLMLKGFDQMIPSMSEAEAKKEISNWEKSYLVLEAYHVHLQSQVEKGTLKGQNFTEFFRIVEMTKAEVASIITSLIMTGRPKAHHSKETKMTEILAEMGNQNLLQLVLK